MSAGSVTTMVTVSSEPGRVVEFAFHDDGRIGVVAQTAEPNPGAEGHSMVTKREHLGFWDAEAIVAALRHKAES